MLPHFVHFHCKTCILCFILSPEICTFLIIHYCSFNYLPIHVYTLNVTYMCRDLHQLYIWAFVWNKHIIIIIYYIQTFVVAYVQYADVVCVTSCSLRSAPVTLFPCSVSRVAVHQGVGKTAFNIHLISSFVGQIDCESPLCSYAHTPPPLRMLFASL